jgi:Na+-driven multidrug efflux pump
MTYSQKIKFASLIFYSLVGFLFIFALIYSFTPGLLPYHIKFLGKTDDQLDPKVLSLLLKASKIIGAALFSMAVTLVFLTKNLAIKNNNWVRWTLLSLTWVFSWPVLIIMLSVSLTTPWYFIILMLIFSLIAFILSKQN